MKKLVFASALFVAVTTAPFAAGAAPKSGCPATPGTPTRWQKTSVDYVGELIAGLGYAPTVGAGVALITQRYDRNDDKLVCLATRWEDLNPKSKHYDLRLYIVTDNNANATK